jgi:hypothetical protein
LKEETNWIFPLPTEDIAVKDRGWIKEKTILF